MYLSKVKSGGGFHAMWIPAITVVLFILFTSLLSARIGAAMLAMVFLLVSQHAFYAWARTRNITYLFSALFTVTYPVFLLFVPHLGILGGNRIVAFSAVFISLPFGIAGMIRAIGGHYHWYGKNLFELVAKGIDTMGNSFTPRPYPAGSVTATRDEIIGFVNFMQQKLVGFAVIDDKTVYLVPVKHNYQYQMIYKSGRRLLESSWVAFNDDGSVSVHISRADYLDYREPLSFNLLCTSMGDLMIEFVDLYRRGEGIRIIDRLKSAGQTIFS